ncbi:Conserved Plasmodium protein, related [Eimeria brunetti]|uniref:Conserved Plasmodium protein, related n=1 Tax=Eimeria brunetti TaxID=51314 RepID=U6LLP5_9EIME|nr:Conserved Plasmodium protein, related [Eimeria brunetti]
MAHMGLLFRSGWFTKSVWGSIFGLVALDKYARWSYGIPDYHNYNLTCWPYALERANLRRHGIDPDTVDLTGEDSSQ